MASDLLERETLLQDLTSLLDEARAGRGRTALVIGEAGIGKTALLNCFVRAQTVRAWWGACEALFTPRPLGPLVDIAHQSRGHLLELIDSGASPQSLFAAFLDELNGDPTVIVFEDVHWADEATLDLIKFIGRRISQVPTLFILTYREENTDPNHPLRLVIGDLPGSSTKRMKLWPLSEDGVIQLAHRAGRPAEGLYAMTGGNPFYVTEALASDEDTIPATVRDAVLARAARLKPAALAVLELASVVPSRIEQWLIEQVLHIPTEVIDECLQHGMLHLENDWLAFRHELARRAVEDSLSPLKRKSQHKAILDALITRGVDAVPLSRLVHHAAQAADAAAVLRFASAAAKQAAALSAHRESATHYATALRLAAQATDEQRAEWLEGRAHECWLTNQPEEALQSRERALEIRHRLGQPLEEARDLRSLGALHWYAGNCANARRYVDEAVALLENIPPSAELARAYGEKSRVCMLVGEYEAAVDWGNRAIGLAQEFAAEEARIHALNTVGVAAVYSGDIGGMANIEMSLELALDKGFDECAARAYFNLGRTAGDIRDFSRAARYYEDGMAFCTARNIDYIGQLCRAFRAWVSLEQARWAEAEVLANGVSVQGRFDINVGAAKLAVLGRLRARRGDPEADTLLAEAQTLAADLGHLPRTRLVATARAERAWLAGDLARCAMEVRESFARAIKHPWILGELAFWLWRGGGLERCPEGLAKPYELQINGDWRGAAAEWQRIGCPYERAMALMDGEQAAQREALAIFEELGAKPAAEIVRRKLHEQGVRDLPRGPRASTRDNPAGLTDRELEVLILMAQGLANPEIARRLFRSAKTVEHHVSAVLAKLGAASRLEAINRARSTGVLPLNPPAAK